jgi:D-glycero-D-manno-heptose 1,7-bisphosphate phosphatase
MSQPLVILDRDGVINEDSDEYIRSVNEWTPIPGSIEAIARLTQAGFMVAVVTNQSGLARGYFTEIDLANMHNYMEHLVENAGGQINAVVYCPHLPTDNCACRKPRTGMLEQLQQELSVPLAGCFFIGDTAKDIDTARAMLCRPVLVRTGKGGITEKQLSPEQLDQVIIVDDLHSAVEYILS